MNELDASQIPANDDKLAYTYDTVADRLEISPKTVMRMVARKDLVAIKVGRSRRVTHASLTAFMTKATAAPPCPTVKKARPSGTSATQMSTASGLKSHLARRLKPKPTPSKRSTG
ncbi:helix-turn-helix domain-containing protein [Nevskia sp.]|uniref:helix-turn-helix domain-containing protein n=1 Tax=Nevskia sp. TaxID=1929292 RepID=UPI0025D5BE32|nr:helix-turn-helix domain-containing protein [Nevskia sp.]